ncbi:L-ascorbate-specific enzyme IIA component of PTS [[Clostridium] ultunense Esp]|uniref:PTS sugar transporter subunit IIA n=1 Tax=Thermicanus aegyptius TaxID=94009 RepID=UPI0002B7041D|nr:PTS sugar transporter subunit IIA [Thermicanus aegyptius]CCQ93227.1 L-ascorbate-specific enzyme IIA component of PTS [[Clostridium] ultunense Esp]
MSVLTVEKARVGAFANDWREAIRIVGNLLVEAGDVKQTYVDAMINAVEKFGPYIVLSPGLALAHARPQDGALKVGLSAALLKNPIDFGHPDNDPVKLVLAFSAIDQISHLHVLQIISQVFSDPTSAERIYNSKTSKELVTQLGFL